MTKQELDIVYFVSFCIEQYKQHSKKTGNEVIDLFDHYKVTDYLKTHYEILHTQSHQWLIEDIDEYINRQQKEKQA